MRDIDDLKCCGNCAHIRFNYCPENKISVHMFTLCLKWKYDEFTMSERIVELDRIKK
jgi:hypothetical protein